MNSKEVLTCGPYSTRIFDVFSAGISLAGLDDVDATKITDYVDLFISAEKILMQKAGSL